MGNTMRQQPSYAPSNRASTDHIYILEQLLYASFSRSLGYPLPSPDVVNILKAGLDGLWPFSTNDSSILIRTLQRLKEIEDQQGSAAAIKTATSLASLLGKDD
jgi:hypothetical protein